MVITEPIAEFLNKVEAENRHGYVSKSLAEDYLINSTRITNRIRKILTKVGLEIYEPGTGPGTGKRAVVQYGFHSLRHTFITRQQRKGTALATLKYMVGHNSKAITDRYTHISKEDVKKAMKVDRTKPLELDSNDILYAELIAKSAQTIISDTCSENWKSRFQSLEALLKDNNAYYASCVLLKNSDDENWSSILDSVSTLLFKSLKSPFV